MIGCPLCETYTPHEHPERLTQEGRKPRIRTKKLIIWFCDQGDVAFCRPEYFRRIIAEARLYPDKTIYFQSKSPSYFEQFVGEFPSNVILLTTLETNKDEGYELISKAPKPSVRYKDFLALNYPRKVVTAEPVMDFDLDIFVDWMNSIKPEYVWLGLNSRPRQVHLLEPSHEKLLLFLDKLEQRGIKTVVKGERLLALLGEYY
jgi:hypothetical protein